MAGLWTQVTDSIFCAVNHVVTPISVDKILERQNFISSGYFHSINMSHKFLTQANNNNFQRKNLLILRVDNVLDILMEKNKKDLQTVWHSCCVLDQIVFPLESYKIDIFDLIFLSLINYAKTLYIYIYIYIYVWREREREREWHALVKCSIVMPAFIHIVNGIIKLYKQSNLTLLSTK